MTLRLSSKTDQELCDMSATSTFPPEGMELPSGRQFKLYQSMNGLNDTPKSVVDGVRSSLCRLDDIMSRCSPCTEQTSQFYRLKPLHDAEARMRKSKLSHQKSRERTGTQSGRRRKPSGSKGPKPSTNLEARISADPEVLSLLTEITRDESRLRKSGSLKGRSRKKSPTKGRTVRLEGGIEVDDSVLSFLSPSGDAPTNRSFSTRLTSRRSDFVLDSARFESSETKGSSKTSRHPKSTRMSNRSGRQSKQVPSSRDAATGRRSHRPGKAAAAPAPARKVQASSPVKKGAAGLLDLSEISKGLEQPGTSYQLDFGERMAEAMASELKSIYANNAQYWLPRTEQTIINERMALERKLQRQIQGHE